MTYLCSTSTALDLPTLDAAIKSHLHAHARRVGGHAERYAMNTGETSAVTALVLVDPHRDMFVGSADAIFGCRMFVHGYEAALSLAVVTSRAPFLPNDRAIAAVLAETREDMAATVADERAKWGLPA